MTTTGISVTRTSCAECWVSALPSMIRAALILAKDREKSCSTMFNALDRNSISHIVYTAVMETMTVLMGKMPA